MQTQIELQPLSIHSIFDYELNNDEQVASAVSGLFQKVPGSVYKGMWISSENYCFARQNTAYQTYKVVLDIPFSKSFANFMKALFLPRDEDRVVPANEAAVSRFFEDSTDPVAQKHMVRASKQGAGITLHVIKPGQRSIPLLDCHLSTSAAQGLYLFGYRLKAITRVIGGESLLSGLQDTALYFAEFVENAKELFQNQERKLQASQLYIHAIGTDQEIQAIERQQNVLAEGDKLAKRLGLTASLLFKNLEGPKEFTSEGQSYLKAWPKWTASLDGQITKKSREIFKQLVDCEHTYVRFEQAEAGVRRTNQLKALPLKTTENLFKQVVDATPDSGKVHKDKLPEFFQLLQDMQSNLSEVGKISLVRK